VLASVVRVQSHCAAIAHGTFHGVWVLRTPCLTACVHCLSTALCGFLSVCLCPLALSNILCSRQSRTTIDAMAASESWSALPAALKPTHPCFDLLAAYKRCVEQ
jgi:hypothetical protein